MNGELSLVIPLPGAPGLAAAHTLTSAAGESKEAALVASALIGKVETRDENNVAGQSLARLQGLSRDLEKQRKRITDPFVDAQRTVKQMVDKFREEIDREAARIGELMNEFAREEQRRANEERERQQAELDRIETDKRSALAQAATPEAVAEIIETADISARIAAKPVEITRARGQSTAKVWKIMQINDFQLIKSRPDLVRKIEWDIAGIKAALAAGRSLPGVTAEEDLRVSVRSGKTIDI